MSVHSSLPAARCLCNLYNLTLCALYSICCVVSECSAHCTTSHKILLHIPHPSLNVPAVFTTAAFHHMLFVCLHSLPPVGRCLHHLPQGTFAFFTTSAIVPLHCSLPAEGGQHSSPKDATCLCTLHFLLLGVSALFTTQPLDVPALFTPCC